MSSDRLLRKAGGITVKAVQIRKRDLPTNGIRGLFLWSVLLNKRAIRRTSRMTKFMFDEKRTGGQENEIERKRERKLDNPMGERVDCPRDAYPCHVFLRRCNSYRGGVS